MNFHGEKCLRWGRGAGCACRNAVVAVLIFLASVFSDTIVAAETVEATVGEGPIRVLFLANQPAAKHDTDKVFPRITKALGRDAIYFDYVRSLEEGLGDLSYLNQFDTVLWHNDHRSIADPELGNLIKFVKSGKGFLTLGHAADLPFMTELIGGERPRFKDTGWDPVSVLPDHPALAQSDGVMAFADKSRAGGSDFELLQVAPKAAGEHQGEPWTWSRKYGKGRAFYTASGSDASDWRNSSFLHLLKGGILWSVGPDRLARYKNFIVSRKPLRYEPRTDIPNFEGVPGGFEFQFPMPAEDSMDYMQVPVGFRLELFASEPDVMNPIYMDWDERGRLWVLQSVDYPHYMKEDQIGNDSIRILEDTDGDGRCDKVTLFAEKLNLPTSFTFSNGGIIVAQAPNFLFLKDTDGDDRADIKELVMTGWGTRDTHAGPSNLQYGLDNRIWGAVGYSGFGGSERYGMRFSNGAYRFQSDGTELEFMYQFSNNAWGLGFNDAGDVFGGGANGAPSFFGVLPEAALAGEGRSATMIANNRLLASITTNVRQTNNFGNFSGATGQFFASSDRFPASWRNRSLFIGGTTGHVINRFTEIPEGGGYRGQNEFSVLASADEWVSPSCTKVGPDGALWILDWYNFIVQHNPVAKPEKGGYSAIKGTGNAHINPNRDNTRGRVYRLVWNGGYKPKTTNLGDASNDELVEALDDDNQFWRMTAQRILVQEKRGGAAKALSLRLEKPGIGAVHSLWVLHGLGLLSESQHVEALKSPDSVLRRNAIKAIGEDASGARLLLRPDVAVFDDTEPLNRRELYNKVAMLPMSEELLARLDLLRDQNVFGAELGYSFKNMLKKHGVVEDGPKKGIEAYAGGDSEQGMEIAFEHPYVNCLICHRMTKRGELVGAEMGPALDGIASTKTPEYILESLLEPNAAFARGYGHFRGASPMPALGSVLSDGEIADLMAYLLTLK